MGGRCCREVGKGCREGGWGWWEVRSVGKGGQSGLAVGTGDSQEVVSVPHVGQKTRGIKWGSASWLDGGGWWLGGEVEGGGQGCERARA